MYMYRSASLRKHFLRKWDKGIIAKDCERQRGGGGLEFILNTTPIIGLKLSHDIICKTLNIHVPCTSIQVLIRL